MAKGKRQKNMANVKRLLCFGIICVFSACGFSEQYPMLEDVRRVSVTIDHAGLEPNEPPVNWANMLSKTEGRLKKAGIEIAPVLGVRLADIPDLRITMKMLALPDTEQFVFHIETSLYRVVDLAEDAHIKIFTPVWTSSTTMQSAVAEDVNDSVSKAALKQVNEFISAWKTAQAKTPVTEPNDNHKKPVKQSVDQPATALKPAVSVQDTYIASKNSKVFHKTDCSMTKTISADNLVTFASRAEAINNGRRPCKKCNP
jgi:hypothetical protein